ncbi:MAG: hypothetical protein QNJ72_38825 [Pleurocapsa sp. MO_226.B13]|nr:hypothetical protein [Pleurocapsa sp. MO_226.B13]
MGRGNGASPSGTRADELDVNYQFDLFPRDDNNQLRTPEINSDESGESFTFAGAIENFQARFFDDSDVFDFDRINITNLFAIQGDEPTSISSEPLTLDLTTRSVGDEASPSSIEYTIDGFDESIGITELTLILNDASTEDDGFQIDEVFEDGFQVGGQTVSLEDATIDVDAALQDIEFIIDNGLLGQSSSNLEGQGLVDEIRVTALDGGVEDSSTNVVVFQNNVPRTVVPILEPGDIINGHKDYAAGDNDYCSEDNYRSMDYLVTTDGIEGLGGEEMIIVNFGGDAFDLMSDFVSGWSSSGFEEIVGSSFEEDAFAFMDSGDDLVM